MRRTSGKKPNPDYLKIPPAPQGTAAISFKNILMSFNYPNYRLWFLGQVISLFGTWMQTTAQGYLVFELTKSPAYLGYTAFAVGLSVWIFMPIGGVAADRFPRRVLLIITQSSLMVLAFVIFSLTIMKIIEPWHILVLSFFQGIITAFDAPARHSFVTEMVTKESLSNAIALNSAMFNMATISGPAISGVIYALFGPTYCFLINAISYMAVILALSFMKIKSSIKHTGKASFLSDIKEGIAYVVSQPVIFTLLILIIFFSFFGFSMMTLLPAWAVNILKGDATTNGLLQSARGVGAFLSVIIIASLGRFKFKGKLLTLGVFVFPVFLFIFSLMRILLTSLLAMVLIGASLILIFNLANSLIQMLVDEKMRGRVMSLYSMTFFGFSPLGGLLLGFTAEKNGEFITMISCSFILIITAIILWVIYPGLIRLE